jgi:hypothetical protein
MGITEESRAELAAQLMPEAERELAAYVRAVQEVFGYEQVWQSVEDWMAELERTDWENGPAAPDWRSITIAAARRIAVRAPRSGFEDNEFSRISCHGFKQSDLCSTTNGLLPKF